MNKTNIEKLITIATNMTNKAYAPYSKFHVGAALQTVTGEIIGGCNVESASYGLTICAERVAIFQAIAQGHKEFTDIVIVSKSGAYPCGACRQVIYEHAPHATITIVSQSKIIDTTTIQKLLPHGFGNHNLTKKETAHGRL